MNDSPKIKKARGPIRWFLVGTGYKGITLPPFGIYVLENSMDNYSLIRHENRHWQQAKETGVLKWYIKYLYYNVRYGYWDNPFEIDARKAE